MTEIPTEIWAVIPGAESYEVSTLGRVRRRPNTYGCRSGRILTPKLDRYGYVKISLALGEKGKYRHTQVHRLVAETFIGPPPSPAHEVAHFDGIRTNNSLSNLRWATAKENADDRNRHGHTHGAKLGESHHNARLSNEAVRSMRKLKVQGLRLEEIAERFGVGRITVYDAVKGRTWSHVQ